MVDDAIDAVVETNHLGVLETHWVEHAEKRHRRVQIEGLLGNLGVGGLEVSELKRKEWRFVWVKFPH